MIRTFGMLALAVAMGAWSTALSAPQDAPVTTAPKAEKNIGSDKKKEIKPRTTVGRAVADLEYVTEARPNPKAKNFIYLFSASWCRYCPATMEMMVREYPKMRKKNQVEVILMSPDAEENIKQYVAKYKAEFPAIRYTSAVAQNIPGTPKAESLPSVMVVNGRGDVLFQGHGSGAEGWENIIKQKPSRKKAKKTRKD